MILYGKAVVVATFATFECKNFWTGTSSGSLICELYAVLPASGAEAASYRIELLFFLLEVVDVDYYRADQNDQKEE